MRIQSKRCRQLSCFKCQTCILCTLFLSVQNMAEEEVARFVVGNDSGMCKGCSCWLRCCRPRQWHVQSWFSSRSSPVPSLALCVGSSDQCDCNRSCPSFQGSLHRPFSCLHTDACAMLLLLVTMHLAAVPSPPGVESAASFDSTRENLPGLDTEKIGKFTALS